MGSTTGPQLSNSELPSASTLWTLVNTLRACFKTSESVSGAAINVFELGGLRKLNDMTCFAYNKWNVCVAVKMILDVLVCGIVHVMYLSINGHTSSSLSMPYLGASLTQITQCAACGEPLAWNSMRMPQSTISPSGLSVDFKKSWKNVFSL